MDNLLDYKELANKLNVSPHWIREHSRPGNEQIPVVRIGRYTRFDLDEVVAHLRGRENMV